MSNDVLFFHDEEKKFKTDQKVRVKEGDFSGVEGIIARFQGQQHVGIVIAWITYSYNHIYTNCIFIKIRV